MTFELVVTRGKHLTVLSVPLILLSLACGERGDPLIPTAIKAHDVFSSDSFGIPVRVLYHRGLLVLIDLAADRPVHILDARTGRFLGSPLRWGIGPGQVKSPWSLFASGGDACVWDLGLQRVTCITLHRVSAETDSLRFAESLPVRTETVRLTGQPTDVEAADSTRVLAIVNSAADSGWVLLINRETGATVKSLGVAPFRDNPGTGDLVRNGDLEKHPLEQLFVVSERYGGRLALLNLEGFAKWFDTPNPFEPIRGWDSVRGSIPGARRVWGYISIAANQEAVYGLFSGGVTTDRPRAEAYGTELHVFSWEGRLLEQFKLDVPALSLTVSPTGEVFTVAHLPTPNIRRYVVKPLPYVTHRTKSRL